MPTRKLASIKKFLSSPLLEKLDISCNNLSGGSFGRELVQGLEQAEKLVSLNLSGCGLVDIEPLLKIDSQSQFVKTIRHLDLSHNPINSQLFSISIRTFMSKVGLEELNLNTCDLSSYAMSCFVSSLLENSTILKLNVSANKFSGKVGLIQLVTVCMLQEFVCELTVCNVIYKESQEIRESQNKLANIIKDKIEGVNVNSRLKKLYLSNCEIDSPFLKLLRANMLTTNVQLSDIDLSSNSGCNAEEFRLFAWGANSEQNILSQLEILTGGSHMGDNIIRLIKDNTFPILKRLSLIRSRISPNRVGNLSEYICKILTSDPESTSSEIPQLTDLALDGIKLSGTNRSAIVNLFNAITFLQNATAKVNWSLTRLSLNSCSLNDSDIKPISKALAHGLNLEYLSLACNRLGDNALVDLVEGLKCCTTLRTIDLANNSLGSKGVTVLADCLSRLGVERILVSGNLIGGDGVLALINLTRMCLGISLLDLRNQKAEFSDQYLDLVYSSVKEIIESRASAGNNKALVVIKLSGVGEQHSYLWQNIDSHYVETNSRKHKLSNVGLWDALTLLYSFKLASTPKLDYIREYESGNKRTSQGVGEVGLFEDEWKEVIGSSTQVPSWLLVEFHRERGVFVSGLSVAVTQNRLEGMLEAEADCEVVEVVMCKDPVGSANGSAWVLFGERNSVDNAIEYYNNGFACLFGEPFIITPLAVRILDGRADGEHMELVRADISQRAEEHAEDRRGHRELIEQKYEESQERHGKLLANPAYQGGRVW